MATVLSRVRHNAGLWHFLLLRGPVVLCAVGTLAITPVQAGSYMQSGGNLDYFTSAGHLWATQRWDRNGILADTDCRRSYSYSSHHLEYGYSYYYTLFGDTNIAQTRCNRDHKEGLSDVRLGVRGRTNVFRNNRTWEVEATVPTSRDSTSSLRLGCGAFGLAGNVARKDELMPWLTAGASSGIQLWEAPLAHQWTGAFSLAGPMAPRSRWSWSLGLDGRAPLNAGGLPPDADVSDCATRGKLVRGTTRLGYYIAPGMYAECGYGQALWGENVTRNQGVYCGFSRRWR